jgi:hypothetical protein
VQYGKGHFQSLENVKKWALADSDNDFDTASVFWGQEQITDLNWWLARPSPIQRFFQQRPFLDEFTSRIFF